jgi:TonB family protein
MKPLIYLTFLFLAIGHISAIAQDTIYLNKARRDTTAADASYYRTRIRQGAVWQVDDHFLNGKPQMTGSFSDDSFHIRQGQCTWYDSTGLPIHEAIYTDNKENGKETWYYRGGQVELAGNYRNGKKDGDFIAYYPGGKISGKAKFVNGRQVSGNFYNQDGSDNPNITDFMRESEYPGGAQEWLAFLNKNLHYPRSAVRNKIEGTVLVQFIINEEGKITDLTVIKSVDPDLDAEAVRVITKSSGKWPPAIFGGRLVKSYKKQPTPFNVLIPPAILTTCLNPFCVSK